MCRGSPLQITEYDRDQTLDRADQPPTRPRVHLSEPSKRVQFSWKQFSGLCTLCCVCVVCSLGQETGNENGDPATSTEQLNVNWIYGAYIAKGTPIISL